MTDFELILKVLKKVDNKYFLDDDTKIKDLLVYTDTGDKILFSFDENGNIIEMI